MKWLHIVSFILLIVGGLNWGASALFDWTVEAVVGMDVARIVYILVGLAAVYEGVTHAGRCKDCSAMSGGMR